MSFGFETPSPRSSAIRRYGIDSGSNPIILAATESIATRVRRRQQVVVNPGNHRPRPGAVHTDRAVHDTELRGMQLTLHVQEIDQHLVHVLVRIVTHLLEQAAEGVLHRTRGHRVTVCP